MSKNKNTYSSEFTSNLRRKKSNQLSIGEALELYFEQANLSEKLAIQKVKSNWSEVLSPEIATKIEDSSCRNGVFYIKIPHAGWRQELSYGLEQIKNSINHVAGMEICKQVVLMA